ncbi:hypothetical protein B9T33_06365 [Acinetobacter sp. ANC 5054]|uniref:tetratricopeptide repeat protein n=1 Tax=Acinetobacter sp. ANC 5054 TaxID=1977877 RepID=UPI000A34C91D|nr:tetratricopeptide repeat protein [Acinetobacter sp. ANC 5054]OTG81290.1 hypothetical protein B9T33_06365 [Acinetobacter sp. ANC 5054]
MQRNYKNSILSLCLCIVFLTGCSSKEEREFKATLKTAESGDVMAQMKVGDLYLEGTGTEKNLEQSLYWYKQAALQGNANAFQQLRQLALAGNHNADVFLSDLLDNGNTLLANWIYQQALASDSQAQYALAWMYDMGIGRIEDPYLAMKWYKKSAEQHNVLAEYIYKERLKRGTVMPHHKYPNTIYGGVKPYPNFSSKIENAYLYHINSRAVKTPRTWNISGDYISNKHLIKKDKTLYLTPDEYDDMFGKASDSNSARQTNTREHVNIHQAGTDSASLH